MGGVNQLQNWLDLKQIATETREVGIIEHHHTKNRPGHCDVIMLSPYISFDITVLCNLRI